MSAPLDADRSTKKIRPVAVLIAVCAIAVSACLALIGLILFALADQAPAEFGVFNDGPSVIHDVRFKVGDHERNLGEMGRQGEMFEVRQSDLRGVASAVITFQDDSRQEHRSAQSLPVDSDHYRMEAHIDEASRVEWRSPPRSRRSD